MGETPEEDECVECGHVRDEHLDLADDCQVDGCPCEFFVGEDDWMAEVDVDLCPHTNADLALRRRTDAAIAEFIRVIALHQLRDGPLTTPELSQRMPPSALLCLDVYCPVCDRQYPLGPPVPLYVFMTQRVREALAPLRSSGELTFITGHPGLWSLTDG